MTSLGISEDRWTADTLLATGVVQVEQFCSGFDGMIPLSVGGAWPRRRERIRQRLRPRVQLRRQAEAYQEASNEPRLNKQTVTQRAVSYAGTLLVRLEG